MQLGNFFIWTYSYQLIRTSSIRWKEHQAAEEAEEASRRCNTDLDADEETQLLKGEDEEQAAVVVSETSVNHAVSTLISKITAVWLQYLVYIFVYLLALLFGRSGLLK